MLRTGVEETSVGEIAQEPRLVDRVDRADAHRAGRELPKVRHQPGVWIGAEPLPARLLSVVGELRLTEPPLEEGARIHTGRGVRLEEHEVAAPRRVWAAEEMVEAGLEDLRRGGIGRDMPAEFAVGLVGAHDHRERVPAHDRREPLLERDIAGMHRLLIEPYGVLVGRIGHDMGDDAQLLRLLLELCQKVKAALAATRSDRGAQRLEPFTGLFGIGVVGGGHGVDCTAPEARRRSPPLRDQPAERIEVVGEGLAARLGERDLGEWLALAKGLGHGHIARLL